MQLLTLRPKRSAEIRSEPVLFMVVQWFSKFVWGKCLQNMKDLENMKFFKIWRLKQKHWVNQSRSCLAVGNSHGFHSPPMDGRPSPWYSGVYTTFYTSTEHDVSYFPIMIFYILLWLVIGMVIGIVYGCLSTTSTLICSYQPLWTTMNHE